MDRVEEMEKSCRNAAISWEFCTNTAVMGITVIEDVSTAWGKDEGQPS